VIQVGTTEFISREPAQITVAGDPGDPNGTTYAALSHVQHAPATSVGTVITQSIDRHGTVRTEDHLAGYGVYAAGYDDQTHHAVANVFQEFIERRGPVYENGVYVEDTIAGVYVVGRPITEPYWTRTSVLGTVKDVLLQCFERRCLTYTQDNPPAWQVEAGNVGQHYFSWRYNTDLLTGSMPTPGPAPIPASESVYWGAYTPGVPWDMAAQTNLESSLGKGMSILHWGQPWSRKGSFQRFPAAEATTVRNHGAIPMINWGSWELGKGRDQPDYQLADITAGTYDSYIRQWALDAKAWGQPFFLRFNHEMNGWWQFPWAEQANGNQPGDFVRAWRHVHDIFREVGATNVTWVWSPNIVSAQTTPLAAVYPGDAYVDWVAMDGYNTLNNGLWMDFATLYGPTYQEMLALAPSKPIMLAEFASNEEGGSKPDWVRDAFLTQLPQHFPQIKAVVWFNWNSHSGMTATFDSSAATLAAFREVLASPYYASNRFSGLSGSPISGTPQ
jgi:hypothetical protein